MKYYCGFMIDEKEMPEICFNCGEKGTFSEDTDSVINQKWYCNTCNTGYEFIEGYSPSKCGVCGEEVVLLDLSKEDDNTKWSDWDWEKRRLDNQVTYSIKGKVVKQNAYESKKAGRAGNDFFVRVMIIMVIFVALIFLLGNILGGSDDSSDGSYYIDYNDNGRMDEGEHAYDVVDGEEHWDLDGDGWWDN